MYVKVISVMQKLYYAKIQVDSYENEIEIII